jgi:glycosyltransferase involved in cell wall biosynthesis
MNPSEPQPPLVSWLICSNVGGRAMDTAIDSCLAQGFRDFEIVVVANGDDAARIFEDLRRRAKDEPRLCVAMTAVRHLNFSLALGLHLCRGTYVARLDADDIAYPNRLAVQVELLQAQADLAVVGSAYELIDMNDAVIGSVKLPRQDAQIRKALLRGNPLCHPAVTFRRQVALDAGGYLGGLHAEDYDLWCRIADLPGIRFANIDVPLIGYRANPDGAARRSRSAYASVAAAQFRNFAMGRGARWCASAIVSALKAAVLSRR